MAVIEYDSYKQKLLAMSDTFENLQKALAHLNLQARDRAARGRGA